MTWSPAMVLKGEHRVIELVLDVLARAAGKAEEDGRADGDTFRKITEFLREFADRGHHAKEEAELFPKMLERGIPREGGPVGVMEYEHEQGRGHVRAMNEAIEAAENGDEDAVRKLAEHARAFVFLLSQHIEKEDHCLFPMAEQAMGEEDLRELERRFRQADDREFPVDRQNHYRAMAKELCIKWGVEALPARVGE